MREPAPETTVREVSEATLFSQQEWRRMHHGEEARRIAAEEEVEQLRATERVLREEITRLRRSMGDAASRMHASLSHATEDALVKAGVALSREDPDGR